MRIVLASTWKHEEESRADTFAQVIERHKKADLIAFPGWTLTPTQFRAVNRRLGGLGSVRPLVLWERLSPHGAIDDDLCSNASGDITEHGRQRFASWKDTQAQSALADDIAKSDEDRWIKVAKRELCWLNCGEIFLLESKGPRGQKTAQPRAHVAKSFETIRSRARIFFNPTHTPMLRWADVADAQAKYLSRGGRIFLRVSNSANLAKYTDKTYQNQHIMAYHDGCRIRPAMEFVFKKNATPQCIVGVFDI